MFGDAANFLVLLAERVQQLADAVNGPQRKKQPAVLAP
jgi:hypothetical protein